MRAYQPLDRAQIESFVCVPNGQRWRIVAQTIIRECPDECESGHAEVFVAAEGSTIFGVIVFRGASEEGTKWEICSIGVLIPRQNQGIGLSLKRAVIAEIVARNGIGDFISTVHKLNASMRAINKKLEAEESPDPLVSEHLLTLVKAEALVKPGDITPSK